MPGSGLVVATAGDESCSDDALPLYQKVVGGGKRYCAKSRPLLLLPPYGRQDPCCARVRLEGLTLIKDIGMQASTKLAIKLLPAESVLRD